jgi:hypothetical protein
MLSVIGQKTHSTSFHSVERFLKELQVRGIAGLLPTAFNPFFLESILRWAVILIKDAEDAGER